MFDKEIVYVNIQEYKEPVRKNICFKLEEKYIEALDESAQYFPGRTRAREIEERLKDHIERYELIAKRGVVVPRPGMPVEHVTCEYMNLNKDYILDQKKASEEKKKQQKQRKAEKLAAKEDLTNKDLEKNK